MSDQQLQKLPKITQIVTKPDAVKSYLTYDLDLFRGRRDGTCKKRTRKSTREQKPFFFYAQLDEDDHENEIVKELEEGFLVLLVENLRGLAQAHDLVLHVLHGPAVPVSAPVPAPVPVVF